MTILLPLAFLLLWTAMAGWLDDSSTGAEALSNLPATAAAALIATVAVLALAGLLLAALAVATGLLPLQWPKL